jgi:hypothetical protein
MEGTTSPDFKEQSTAVIGISGVVWKLIRAIELVNHGGVRLCLCTQFE